MAGYKTVISFDGKTPGDGAVIYKETVNAGQKGYVPAHFKLISSLATTVNERGPKVTITKVSKDLATGAAQTTVLATLDFSTAVNAVWAEKAAGVASSTTANAQIGYRAAYTAQDGTAVAAFGEQLVYTLTTASTATAAPTCFLVSSFEG